MKKHYLVFAAIILAVISGCQNETTDITDQAKEAQFNQAVYSEVNELFKDGRIELLDSTGKSTISTLSENEGYVFTFTNEEDNEVFKAKVYELLQETYGDDWEEQVQSETESNITEESSEQSRATGTQGYMKWDYGVIWALVVSTAWAFTEPYGTSAVYSGAIAKLGYKFSGPWQSGTYYAQKYKANTNARVTAQIWSVGTPANAVSVVGSYHAIDGGVYNNTPPYYWGNY